MAFTYITCFFSVLLGVLLPGAIIGLRETVKRQRKGLILDLESVFGPIDNTKKDDILPSFEFVKYKYFLGKADIVQDKDSPSDIRLWNWLLSLIPFSATVFVLTQIVIGTFFGGVAFRASLPPWWKNNFDPAGIAGSGYWLRALVAAFAGGYLATTRNLFKAINNFDLSPASFISATISLLTGVITAMIFTIAVPMMSPKEPTVEAAFALPVLLVAFLIGYLPDLGIRTITRRTGLRSFKREDESVYKSFKATPIEIIDGIDSEIRSRLSDYHIYSVQNLAAANPIMLFVETPYGVYQIMDWVSQAQLCASVGPKAVVDLWKLGVRTMFDLERLALNPVYIDDALLKAAGKAILSQAMASQNDGAAKQVLLDEAPNRATIVADIRMRLDDPHVHRLRQIIIRVTSRLGDDSRRLPLFTKDCSGPVGNKCPLQ